MDIEVLEKVQKRAAIIPTLSEEFCEYVASKSESSQFNKTNGNLDGNLCSSYSFGVVIFF